MALVHQPDPDPTETESVVWVCGICGDASIAFDICTGKTITSHHRNQRRVPYVPQSTLAAQLEAADELIKHLQRDRGHTECRVQTGRGSYQCRFIFAYEAARALRQPGEGTTDG